MVPEWDVDVGVAWAYITFGEEDQCWWMEGKEILGRKEAMTKVREKLTR